jgi:hypothetical protein
MTYRTYSILIADADFSRWVDVCAVSEDAAIADVVAAYGNVRVVQWGCK